MTEPEIVRLAFICTANSVRSQMAEGFARAWAKDHVAIESAGLSPMGVSRRATEVMAEVGIDLSGQTSKGIEALSPDQDFVITLCDDAARYCGTIPAKRASFHWSIPDPSGGPVGLEAWRDVRDLIARTVRAFLADNHLLKDS